MSIFDDEAIEAAARKIAVAAGRKEHDWAAFRVHTRIALDAAVSSLNVRDKLHYREGLVQLQDGSWITRQGHSIRRDQQVAIIRLPIENYRAFSAE